MARYSRLIIRIERSATIETDSSVPSGHPKAFKILAAGRLSERREWVENAFKQTFAGIKPTDGVLVGIYDKFSDQPAEDAGFVRRFGAAAGLS